MYSIDISVRHLSLPFIPFLAMEMVYREHRVKLACFRRSHLKCVDLSKMLMRCPFFMIYLEPTSLMASASGLQGISGNSSTYRNLVSIDRF